jgi:hypothetical protein
VSIYIVLCNLKKIIIITHNIIVLINKRYNTSLRIIVASTKTVFVDAKDFFMGRFIKKKAPVEMYLYLWFL